MRLGSGITPERSDRGQWALLWLTVLWVMGAMGAPAAGQPDAPAGHGEQGLMEAHWHWPRDAGGRDEAAWEHAVTALAGWWLERDLSPPEHALPTAAAASLAPEGAGGLAWTLTDGASLNAQRAAVHRSARTLQLGDGPTEASEVVLLEALVDFNAMRRLQTERMAWGDGAEALAYWKLSNARDVMLHVRTVPRPRPLPMVLTVDVTWASRSEPMDSVQAKRVSLPIGPVEAVELAGEGDAWVVRLPLDLRLVVARALAVSMAARFGDEMYERDALRWARSMRDRLTRLQAVLAREVIISGGEQGVRVRVPLARERGGRSVASDLEAMKRPLGEDAQAETRAGLGAGRVDLGGGQRLAWQIVEVPGGAWLEVHLGAAQAGP